MVKSSGIRENLKEAAGVADEFFHDRRNRCVLMRNDQEFIIQIQIADRPFHDRGGIESLPKKLTQRVLSISLKIKPISAGEKTIVAFSPCF